MVVVTRRALIALVLLLVAGLVGAPRPTTTVAASASGSVASWCRGGTSIADLTRMFDGDPARIVGADYPRTLALPDGRVLWTFQDPVVTPPGGDLRNLHNAAVVQTDNCFEFLRSGTTSNPRPWLLDAETTTERAWFWPLDMTLSADERTVFVFLAQMFEDGDDVYLNAATPNSVVVVTLDAATLAVTGGPFTPSWGVLSGADRTLYGWSAETAGNHTYLFGHCHRQFGFDDNPFLGGLIHDTSCTREVRLARVPRGDVFAQLEYWTGSGWSTSRTAARPLFDTGRVGLSQPSQFQFVNGRWLATTKVDDWWGQFLIIDEADKVTGPWRQRAVVAVSPKCPTDQCNTYFSSFVDDPSREADDPVVISLSHNRWDGIPRAEIYRPSYLTIAPPPHEIALADRCSLQQC